jgi:hypothetical protein
MDLVTAVGDTIPAWLGGIGGILAALIAGYALFRATRAEERHVEWQISNERRDGRRTGVWRLVNTTSGVKALVTGFDNVSNGERDALRGGLNLPAEVAPGHWMPFDHSRSMASPYPTVVRVSWREGKPHGRIRRRTYSSTLYVD